MRFHAEWHTQTNHWLVFDAENNNEIVGVHVSGTLAALDAIKREQDIMTNDYSPRTTPKPAA